MRVNIKATNIELNDVIRDYLDKRLRSLDKLIDTDDSSVLVDIELGRTTRHHQRGDIFFAEINGNQWKKTFRVVSESSDILSAIDAMRDGIAGELSSRKGKLRSLSRRGGQIAKALLRGGYDGLAYLGRPARAGWKYMKARRWWRKNQ